MEPNGVGMTEEEALLWASLLHKVSDNTFWSIQRIDAALPLTQSALCKVVYQSPAQRRPSVELLTNAAVVRYLHDHLELEQKYVFR
jgi:hypothetical protein